MPSLSANVTNRVRKLPKPSNATQGLQPLFEAVSNAIYAIEDRYGAERLKDGSILVSVEDLGNPRKLRIRVEDDGVGLDEARFTAFCEIDTDFKIAKGGKGVGRLFWLDAFKDVLVDSKYTAGEIISERAFTFVLRNEEQVEESSSMSGNRERVGVGTTVTFGNLNDNEYAEYFPKRSDSFLRYFSAHFIADFLMGTGPTIDVQIGEDITCYPQEIRDLVVGDAVTAEIKNHKDFDDLKITGFFCHKEASTGLDGVHLLHLLANGRTVESQKIDNLIALTDLQKDGVDGLCFHGCVSGKYLDDRVNEGRTAFNIPENLLKEVSRTCVDKVKLEIIPDQIARYSAVRRQRYDDFVHKHPIYGFDDADTQLDRVPFHATSSEEFASGLVKYQIRRDEERQEAIQNIIDALECGDTPPDLAATISQAAKDIHASEQLALAQHVVRRKMVLELLEKLLLRFRKMDSSKDDYQLESTLHSFICPMSIRGDDPSEVKSRAHDLWIVDERLSFTRAFSSDKRLDKVLQNSDSNLRPDLFVWDLAYGMGVADPEKDPEHADLSEPLKKVMVVEFKKPGRRIYAKAEDNVEQQITKYLAQLKNGEIETFDRKRVRIADDCIFYCYIIADIVGELETQLSNWDLTANGEGRIRALTNSYRGSIEVIQWEDLVNDAWNRNKASLFAAGLNRAY